MHIQAYAISERNCLTIARKKIICYMIC